MVLESAAPRSRRALLAAGLAAGAAVVATAVTRPLPADAANGETVHVGDSLEGTSATVISGTSNTAIEGHSGTSTGVFGVSNSNSGVLGQSDSGSGVSGVSTSQVGIWGWNFAANVPAVVGEAEGGSTGVFGWSGSGGLPAVPAKTGVYGLAAQDAASVGVRGESPDGTGVVATTTTGTALQVTGKAKFNRSGKASVLAGKTYVDVTVTGGLASNSVVHATMQTYRSGVGIAAARKNYPTAGKVRIYLTKVASTTASTSIAWLVTEY